MRVTFSASMTLGDVSEYRESGIQGERDPFYARLRAEEPVFRTIVPGKQPAWLVSRYDDVAAVLKDERFAKDKSHALSPGTRASSRGFRACSSRWPATCSTWTRRTTRGCGSWFTRRSRRG